MQSMKGRKAKAPDFYRQVRYPKMNKTAASCANSSSYNAPKKQLALTKSISATGDVLADSNVDTDETHFDEMATVQQLDRPTLHV